MAVIIVLAGYRMGTLGGMAVMAGGVLVFGYVVQSTAWSIPTIGEVHDRAREDGLGVPRDLREHDPDIVQSQRFWGSLDTPSGSRAHPDHPGTPH